MLKTRLKPIGRGSSIQVVDFILETTITNEAKSGSTKFENGAPEKLCTLA